MHILINSAACPPSESTSVSFLGQLCNTNKSVLAVKLAGACADLTLAMIPRSVTMALALPIASQLHASAGITALGVMLTGHAQP